MGLHSIRLQLKCIPVDWRVGYLCVTILKRSCTQEASWCIFSSYWTYCTCDIGYDPTQACPQGVEDLCPEDDGKDLPGQCGKTEAE